ncbi:MAG: metallopeptidase family protein [Novosphingobium sp.]
MRSFRRDPDAAEIERLARAALRQLPEPFAVHLADIVLRVEEFADPETLRAVGLNDRWELTGLYHGRPVGESSQWSSGDLPPMITLFRAPLVDEWHATGVALDALIRHVVVHEVGHHFGLSDDDMHALED